MHWISINDVTYTSTTSDDAAELSLAVGAVLAIGGVVAVCIFFK